MNRTKILSALACFLLSVALLATVIDGCCFDQGFYAWEYAKNYTSDVTGMSQEDNLRATVALLDYLRGTRGDIVVHAKVNDTEREVFNERETLHMVDVRALYQKALLARNIAAVLGIAILVFLTFYEKKKLREVLKTGFVPGVSALLALVVFVAVWAIADFDQFWTNFHLLLFDNDLWLLDPRTSIMINLFPATFFFDLVIRIILIFLFLMIAASFFIFQPWRRS